MTEKLNAYMMLYGVAYIIVGLFAFVLDACGIIKLGEQSWLVIAGLPLLLYMVILLLVLPLICLLGFAVCDALTVLHIGCGKRTETK